MNGHETKTVPGAAVTPGSPATKRKPVPTPRSTLRKPTPADEQARKKLIINNGIDSQVGLSSFLLSFGTKSCLLSIVNSKTRQISCVSIKYIIFVQTLIFL